MGKVKRIDPEGRAYPGWENWVKVPPALNSHNGAGLLDVSDDGKGGCYALFDESVPYESPQHGDYAFLAHIDSSAQPDPKWGGSALVMYDKSADSQIRGNLTPDGRNGAIVFVTKSTTRLYRINSDKKFDPEWGGEGGVDLGQSYFPIHEYVYMSDRRGGVIFCQKEALNAFHFSASGSMPPGWPRDGIGFDCWFESGLHPGGSGMDIDSEGSLIMAGFDTKDGKTHPYAQKLSDPPNFNTYVLLQNPNDTETEATLTFMMGGGETKEIKRSVEAHSRNTVCLNDEVPALDVSTRVEVSSDLPIIAERSMYFDYQGAWQGGSDCSGVPSPEKTWYLAEGYTAGNFDTYLLLQNPGDKEADVTVTYMLPGSKTITQTYKVGAHSRSTVPVDSVPGLESTEVSMKIDASEPVVAERSMYFDYYGRAGGHEQAGVPSPSKEWFLPEGYTGESFDTYLLVMNPNEQSATVNYAFMTGDGRRIETQAVLGPRSRYTLKADDIPGLSSAEFSTRINSDVPVVTERAVYFDYHGKAGGHDSVGATSTSSVWYLAEGYTGGSFDTYALLLNPNGHPVTVKATYMMPGGATKHESYTINADSRYTIPVDSVPGLSGTEVSLKLETEDGSGIVAERSMYFTYQGKWSGGHDTIGVTSPSPTWYFAEGYTGY